MSIKHRTSGNKEIKQPEQSALTPHTIEDAAQFISKLKFQKKLLGGVDELNVIKKLEELQKIYTAVLENQAAYYQALIDERDREIERLTSHEEKGS